mgnify:CR=1 FL=1
MLWVAWDQLKVALEGLEKLRTSVLVAVGLSVLGFIVLFVALAVAASSGSPGPFAGVALLLVGRLLVAY